jgi:FAD-dependent oxidoreductase family protein
MRGRCLIVIRSLRKPWSRVVKESMGLSPTKEGPLSVRARVTIDASGDADIVAMAGLPTFVGQGGCGPRLFLCLSRDSRLGQRIDHSLPVEVAYSGMDRVSHSPCL